MKNFTFCSLVALLLLCTRTQSFSTLSRNVLLRQPLLLRGGQQEDLSAGESTASKKTSTAALPLGTSMAAFGAWYASCIETYPIRTKSATAGVVFGLSDYLAQRLEAKKDKPLKINWTRVLSSVAVGFFYFGPAAHYWYDAIFKLLPATTLVSTLQKAALGQLIFGPSFTCIFFGVSLLQSGTFTIPNWFRKIRNDLPGAWLAGAGFWPVVDLVSYSFVPMNFIPLFINLCSLVWTIYLSLVANR